MKKSILTGTLLAVLACTACTAEKPAESASAEPTAEAAAEAVPAELEGTYYEQIAGRGSFVLFRTDTGAHLDVIWGSSAFETSRWEIEVTYDRENSRLVYENAFKTDVVFESETKSTETVAYDNGTGYFEIGDGTLTWYDDMAEGDEPSVFVKDSMAGMANPWTETQDLDEALGIAGFAFDPPVTEALPQGDHAVELQGYLAMPGTVCALYEGAGGSLQVRKSADIGNEDISGDFNTYTESWEENFKGLPVHCEGDGTLVNKALFTAGDHVYSVCFNTGEEGRGLRVDELQSLVMGMQ